MMILGLLLTCGTPHGTDEPNPRRQPDPAPQIDTVCINELMPRPVATAVDDVDATDWLELSGSPGESLTGWSMLWRREDERSHPLNGLELDEAGFLVLFADGNENILGRLPFQLDGDGEELGLEAPDGSREWITWGPTAADRSLGRIPDCCRGDGCWAETWNGTPGWSNTSPQATDTGAPGG